MGRHSVEVISLHITYARTVNVDYSRFSFWGLHGKHVVTVLCPWSTVGRSMCWSLIPYRGDVYLRDLSPRLLHALLCCRTSLSIAWYFVFGTFWFRVSVLRLTGCWFKLWYSEFWHTSVCRKVLFPSSGSMWVANVIRLITYIYRLQGRWPFTGGEE
jgi:hypothetical protein